MRKSSWSVKSYRPNERSRGKECRPKLLRFHLLTKIQNEYESLFSPHVWIEMFFFKRHFIDHWHLQGPTFIRNPAKEHGPYFNWVSKINRDWTCISSLRFVVESGLNLHILSALCGGIDNSHHPLSQLESDPKLCRPRFPAFEWVSFTCFQFLSNQFRSVGLVCLLWL